MDLKSFEDLSQQSWYSVSTSLKLKQKLQSAYHCELSLFRFTCSTTPPAHLWMQQYCFYYIPQYLFYAKFKEKKLKGAHARTFDLSLPLRNAPILQHQSQNFVGYDTFLGQVCRAQSSGCLLQCNT